MATAGLSLVGFMERQAALDHLRKVCVPDPPEASDEVLAAQWQQARVRLGPPKARAGQPRIQAPLPAAAPYLHDLAARSWVAAALRRLVEPRWAMVEIEPLLAFQPTIDLDRIGERCPVLRSPPALEELLELCLPAVPPADDFRTSPVTALSETMTITSRDQGLALTGWGVFNVDMYGFPSHIAGIRFHTMSPLAQAVSCEGRYYLYQGYHRAYAIRQAGAREMPCLVHQVSPAELPDGVFDPALYAAADPPTMAHFTHGRAHEVRLRAVSHIIEVSWRQYLQPEE